MVRAAVVFLQALAERTASDGVRVCNLPKTAGSCAVRFSSIEAPSACCLMGSTIESECFFVAVGLPVNAAASGP